MPAAQQKTDKYPQTGPRTAEGKAASRYNALKHGIYSEQQIMFDESAEDLAELTAEYHEQHHPANATERELVDTLIHNEWRLRRMRRVEAVLWEHAANSYLTQHPDEPACNSADAFVTNSGAFERLQRIVNACERNFHRALKELVARGHARRTSQPEESKPAPAPDIPFRQTPQTSASPAPQPPKRTPPPLHCSQIPAPSCRKTHENCPNRCLETLSWIMTSRRLVTTRVDRTSANGGLTSASEKSPGNLLSAGSGAPIEECASDGHPIPATSNRVSPAYRRHAE